jgi:hypothetical protein
MEATSNEFNTPLAVLVPSTIRHVGNVAFGAIYRRVGSANRQRIKAASSPSPEENDENARIACRHFRCGIDLASYPGLVEISRPAYR